MALQGGASAGGGDIVPVRIERGAEVFATDGALGTVEQVVMDQTSHEPQGIVVRPLGAAQEVLIGISHVTRAGDNQVYLDFAKADMAANPRLAQPYNPAAYVPVSPGAGLPPEQAARIAGEVDQPVVTRLEQDAVEIVAPSHEIKPASKPVDRERLTADWHVPGSIASVAPRRREPLEPSRTTTPPAPRAPVGFMGTPETSEMPVTGTPVTGERTPERTVMKNTNERPLKTPQAPSAAREAQRITPNPESAAYVDENTVPTSTRRMLPGWVMPVAIGAGAAAVAAGVTFGVIAWRRSMRPTGLDWWRMQLKQMARDPQKASRRLITSAQKSARKALPQIADVGELAADQLDGWRDMLSGQVDAWRDTVGGPAMDNAKQISKLASKNAAKGMATWAATLAAVAAIASDALDTWREALSDQLDDWRGTVGDSLNNNSKSLSKTLSRSAKQVTRGPRRVVTRAMLSMRWFRRGILFGSIGGAVVGLLFAPISGSQLRAQIYAWMRQMSGQLQATMANAQASLPPRPTAGTAMSGATNVPNVPGSTSGSTSGAGTMGTTKSAKPTTGSRLSETGPIH